MDFWGEMGMYSGFGNQAVNGEVGEQGMKKVGLLASDSKSKD
jgi:hypothetical protein